MALFEQCVSSVLMENEDIWNFPSSLTLNIKRETNLIFIKPLV